MQGAKNIINFRYKRMKYNLARLFAKIKNYILHSLFGKNVGVQSIKRVNKKKRVKNRY